MTEFEMEDICLSKAEEAASDEEEAFWLYINSAYFDDRSIESAIDEASDRVLEEFSKDMPPDKWYPDSGYEPCQEYMDLEERVRHYAINAEAVLFGADNA